MPFYCIIRHPLQYVLLRRSYYSQQLMHSLSLNLTECVVLYIRFQIRNKGDPDYGGSTSPLKTVKSFTRRNKPKITIWISNTFPLVLYNHTNKKRRRDPSSEFLFIYSFLRFPKSPNFVSALQAKIRLEIPNHRAAAVVHAP